jgi:hypothetical protein
MAERTLEGDSFFVPRIAQHSQATTQDVYVDNLAILPILEMAMFQVGQTPLAISNSIICIYIYPRWPYRRVIPSWRFLQLKIDLALITQVGQQFNE